MVFLESAGLPEATASDDIEGAAGLTQILAGTATELLGMRVDVAGEPAPHASASAARSAAASRSGHGACGPAGAP